MTSTAAPTRFSYPAGDGLDIAAYRWDTSLPVRGIVQLTHGMGEHVLRYSPFATTLTERGFVVYGQDHRGHGASAGTFGELGANGWRHLVDDIGRLSAHARAEHPGVPLVLFAHSMGSFAAQQYVLDRSGDLDALVLTGTAVIDLLEPALDLSSPLDLSMFNAPFAPARTDFDWLSRDDAQVDTYIADERCGFGIDPDSTREMFAGARAMADPQRLSGIRSDLPVYIAVGEADPVNGQLALVHPLVDRLRAAGSTDVTLRTYPGARHELLNETNSAEVVGDILDHLDRVVPAE